MALGPQNLALATDEEIEADKIEADIDAAIRKEHPGMEFSITLLTPASSDRIMTEIIIRYKQAGWKHVEWDDDDTITFSMTPCC